MSTGRLSPSATDYYPDFSFQTGVSLPDASREDMQLYFFCNNVQAGDCAGITKPCSCSVQPCVCFGSAAGLSLFEADSENEATSNTGPQEQKPFFIATLVLAFVALICLSSICYLCKQRKDFSFEVDDLQADKTSQCELRL